MVGGAGRSGSWGQRLDVGFWDGFVADVDAWLVLLWEILLAWE